MDDEPNVLASLKLMLTREYVVDVASSGAAGLELLASLDPVPVVVSDMRMPDMSGAEFLGEVAARYPNTSRILLTGASDIESAVHAVNAGDLFRFLLKPCPQDHLRRTLKAAIAQHRLIASERDLLQRTLVGSIRALTEVLGIADPVAFGRTSRLKVLATSVAERLKSTEIWTIESAALLCQLGHISLPTATAERLYAGLPTTVQERSQIEVALRLAPTVTKHIARLEPVTRILEDLASDRASDDARLAPGARILRVVLAYEALERTISDRLAAVEAFQLKRKDYDAETCDALMHVLGANWPPGAGLSEQIRIDKLRAGMVTASEVHSSIGALIVPAGVEISAGLIAKLANFPPGYLPARIAVQLPTLA